MFASQIAPNHNPPPAPKSSKDQAHRHLAPASADVSGAEIGAIDLSPSFCCFCGVSIRRFEDVCAWCRNA